MTAQLSNCTRIAFLQNFSPSLRCSMHSILSTAFSLNDFLVFEFYVLRNLANPQANVAAPGYVKFYIISNFLQIETSLLSDLNEECGEGKKKFTVLSLN